ncbi:MAG TPA: VanZ family protein [Thermoanaerobaculia bacterium]
MRVHLRLWLPPIAWALLILASSGDAGSSSTTESLLRKLVAGLGEDAVFYINYVIRKGGHLFAYGILAALNYRALRGLTPGWRLRWSVAAVLLAIAVACIDEFRQSESVSRTGTLTDVGFDFCGAVLAQLVVRRGK